MKISEFSKINKHRCLKGFNHTLESWSASDWGIATVGELGEACNIIKKLNRVRDSIAMNKQHESAALLRYKLRQELADTYIYLDLLCQSQDIDLEQAVIDTFNNKSIELKLSDEFIIK